jgi:hypothetical protein
VRSQGLGFAYWLADGRLASDGTPDAEFDFKAAVELKHIKELQAAREAEERRFRTQSIIGKNEAILAAARPLRAQVRRELAEALRPATKSSSMPMYGPEQGDVAAIAEAYRERLLRQVDQMPGMRRMGIEHGDPYRIGG